MYSELIYTRCGQGVDILRGGAPITNAGFKVFTCSSDLLRGKVADLALLQNVAQRKEPFSDPTFMDDAYVYMTPDYGGKFLVNFHPVPFDRNAAGDYAHRPGAFINQIFVGSFGDFYPYETFGNDALWDAQKRSEAYYYETKPTALEPRATLTSSTGKITVDAIAQFVADGRREALMSAIAFVVSQFELPQEKRKSLVVKDENSTNIELWIAAIERAFSPRMASGLSFATRLDDFANSNQYVVDLNGKFAPQGDLESAGTLLRRRAMIVGVDERDKNNAATRTAPYLPFVVLDGKSKSPLADVDYSHPYYRCVTNYEQKQGATFCEVFLQTLDVAAPTPRVLQLYEAFDWLFSYGKERQFDRLAQAITVLDQYPLLKTQFLKKLYDFVKKTIPDGLGSDALFDVVIPWIERVSAVVGDESQDSIRQSVEETVCSSFVESVYKTPSAEKTKEIYRVVTKSAVGTNATKLLTSQETIDTFHDELERYQTENWLAFSEYFIDVAKKVGASQSQTLENFFLKSVQKLAPSDNESHAIRLASLYIEEIPQAMNILLEETRKENSNATRFKFLLDLVTSISKLDSQEDYHRFYQTLKDYGLDSYIVECLKYKALKLRDVQAERTLVNWACSELGGAFNIDQILTVCDEKIELDESSKYLAQSIVEGSENRKVLCKRSAHVLALGILEDVNTTSMNIKLGDLQKFQFPSIEDEKYASTLIQKLFNQQLSLKVFEKIVEMATDSDFYTQKICEKAVEILKNNPEQVTLQFAILTNRKELIIQNSLKNALTKLSEEDGKRFQKNTKRIQKSWKNSEKELKGLGIIQKNLLDNYDELLNDLQDDNKQEKKGWFFHPFSR